MTYKGIHSPWKWEDSGQIGGQGSLRFSMHGGWVFWKDHALQCGPYGEKTLHLGLEQLLNSILGAQSSRDISVNTQSWSENHSARSHSCSRSPKCLWDTIQLSPTSARLHHYGHLAEHSPNPGQFRAFEGFLGNHNSCYHTAQDEHDHPCRFQVERPDWRCNQVQRLYSQVQLLRAQTLKLGLPSLCLLTRCVILCQELNPTYGWSPTYGDST